MKITCVSDVHGRYEFGWPRADVLVLAGDVLPNFSGNKRGDTRTQQKYFESTFLPLVDKLKSAVYEDIIIIPGNHDTLFAYETLEVKEAFDELGIHFLVNRHVEVQGKLFWGSPWTPWFHGDRWVFNLPDPKKVGLDVAAATAAKMYGDIRSETDVIITHGPPKGILDYVPSCDKYAGCPELLEAIERIKPALSIFGHIHEGAGIQMGAEKAPNTTFINASICTATYKATNPVQIVEL